MDLLRAFIGSLHYALPTSRRRPPQVPLLLLVAKKRELHECTMRLGACMRDCQSSLGSLITLLKANALSLEYYNEMEDREIFVSEQQNEEQFSSCLMLK